jgi:hypothetical protein
MLFRSSNDIAGSREEIAMSVLAADNGYPLLDVMWTMFAFFLWVIWIWLLISVFSDIFRRHDMSGWGKAGWSVLVLVLPFLGVFIYLVSQGHHMQDRAAADQQAAIERAGYVRAASTNGHVSGEITEAKQLLDSGAITPAEYDVIKQKALAS